jgi:hypothetical protein
MVLSGEPVPVQPAIATIAAPTSAARMFRVIEVVSFSFLGATNLAKPLLGLPVYTRFIKFFPAGLGLC